MTLVMDDRLLLHLTPPPVTSGAPPHPEHHARLLSIFHRLRLHGLLAAGTGVRVVPTRRATTLELARVHPPAHLRAVADFSGGISASGASDARRAREFHLDPRAAANEARRLDGEPDEPGAFRWDVHSWGDTYAGPGTAAAAALSAGGALRAFDALAARASAAAFALVRPPGHHCHAAAPGGFCFYNNAALAAAAARVAWPADRVAIVDIDVHHGDGSAAVFASDPNVLVLSVHRFGAGFYPNSGAAGDVGEGAGASTTVNVPLAAGGLGDADYDAVFAYIVLPLLAEFGARTIILSAGFDAAEGDPLGGMRVSPAGYAAMVGSLAALDPPGGLLVTLEGGYNLASIGACAEATMRALAAGAQCSRRLTASAAASSSSPRSPPPVLLFPDRQPSTCVHAATLTAMAQVASVQAPHWRCMAALHAAAPRLLGGASGVMSSGSGGSAAGATTTLQHAAQLRALQVCIPLQRALVERSRAFSAEAAAGRALDVAALVLAPSPAGTAPLGALLAPVPGFDVEARLEELRREAAAIRRRARGAAAPVAVATAASVTQPSSPPAAAALTTGDALADALARISLSPGAPGPPLPVSPASGLALGGCVGGAACCAAGNTPADTASARLPTLKAVLCEGGDDAAQLTRTRARGRVAAASAGEATIDSAADRDIALCPVWMDVGEAEMRLEARAGTSSSSDGVGAGSLVLVLRDAAGRVHLETELQAGEAATAAAAAGSDSSSEPKAVLRVRTTDSVLALYPRTGAGAGAGARVLIDTRTTWGATMGGMASPPPPAVALPAAFGLLPDAEALAPIREFSRRAYYSGDVAGDATDEPLRTRCRYEADRLPVLAWSLAFESAASATAFEKQLRLATQTPQNAADALPTAIGGRRQSTAARSGGSPAKGRKASAAPVSAALPVAAPGSPPPTAPTGTTPSKTASPSPTARRKA